MKIYRAIFLFLITLNSVTLSVAQVLPNVGNPGAIMQHDLKQKDIERELRPHEIKQEILDPSLLEDDSDSDTNTDKSKEEQTEIYIENIELEGTQSIRQIDSKRIIEKYEQKYLTFKEIEQIAQNLTELYRSNGYVTSEVYVPPQKIQDGVLVLKVLEGMASPITVEEGIFFKSRSALPRMQIVGSRKALNSELLLKDLSKLNENPDMGISAVLKKGSEPGKTEVHLKFNENYPFHITPYVDNMGRKSIGNERFGLNFTHNNLLGFGDTLSSDVYFTKDFSIGTSHRYEIPVGKYGTKLGFLYSHSRLRLQGDEDIASLNVSGFATTYSPYISQEIFRNNQLIVNADLAFDIKNSGTNIGDAQYYRSSGAVSRDRLRILKPGFNIQEFDKYGKTFFRGEVGFGIDALDASDGDRPLSSRQGADPSFWRLNANAHRIQRLPAGMFNISRFSLQVTDDELLSMEQMQLGGAYTVRGYKEGQLIGDSGILLSNELHIPFYIFPEHMKFFLNRSGLPVFLAPKDKTPYSEYVLRDNIHLVPFIDVGGLLTNREIAPTREGRLAAGTGIGLRVRLTRLLTGRLDVGFPLIRDLPSRHDLYIHFGIQSSIL